MGLYEAGVLGPSATTANDAVFALWNRSSVARIFLREMGIVCSSTLGPTQFVCKRITARGTQNATVLGTALDNADANPQGILDGNWSVMPTVGAQVFHATAHNAQVGTGHFFQWWMGAGLAIPPGAGVALVAAVTATMSPEESYAVWEESGA